MPCTTVSELHPPYHLWYGGWSSLTVVHGIYFFFYAWIALAIVGLFRMERSPAMLTLLAWYGFFWLGQLYHLLVLFLGTNAPQSVGWYMYAVVGAEVILCLAGLRAIMPEVLRPWVPAAGVLL